MAIAGLGWTDRSRTGRLTASSEVSGLGVGNLQNDHGSASMGWQTVGTSGWFRIETDSADNGWQAFLLARTNLTPSATVRWRVGNDPTFATWNWDTGVQPAGVARGIGQSLTVAPLQLVTQVPASLGLLTEDGSVIVTEAGGTMATALRGRYCRCDIADTGNPDGFLNVPLAYAGLLVQPRRNIGWGTTLGRNQAGSTVRSRGGSSFTELQWMARRWAVEFASLGPSEVWPLVMDLDGYARRGRNVLFVPDPDSPDRNREAVFGQLTPTADVAFPFQTMERRSWRATIEERL
ncbi:hypothetical protein [Roseomonas sp. BN140053]|uniref:hypothetical protein n=1 Tax=Roseomonas sp. BN140053 TaxID=3391898 RepID=UPI0039E7E137